MATYPNILFVFLPLTLSTVCFYGIPLTEALKGGFSVQLIHRDSPKSPFYNPTETPFQQLNNAFHRSFNRVNYFYRKSKVSQKTPQSVITSNQGEYLVQYSIGTPPFEVMGIADTGSDLIWLQCKPCDQCYNQTNPLFDPSKSVTYEPVSCYSRVCQSVGQTYCYSDSVPNCEYTASYGDGSHSQGNLAFDTLTLGSTTGSSVAFPKIPIGCGVNNAGTFDSKGSGIVGLGGGVVSLTSQIGPSIDFKFSYCLVPLFESEGTSKLNFGENAVVAGSGTVSTPIIPSSIDTFYYLKLEGMSVGSKRIEFVGDSTSNDAEGNIIIDSGTTLTFLPEKIYAKLESEVAAQISLERVNSTAEILSLCYKSPANNAIQAPLITVHFTGADVGLNSLNTFVSVSDDVTCFAFAPVASGSLFGNLAQMNHLVGYDLLKKTVTFDSTHNMATYSNNLFVFSTLTLSTICFCGIPLTEALKGGFSVQLIHRDSPKSPFYNPAETPFQQLNNAFHRSFNRANHFYPKSKVSQETPQSVITSNHGEYLVKYSIGTPPFEVMGIADTGSDLVWTQCKPCEQCYNQTNPLFDPSKSVTYEPVSCYSSLCLSVRQSNCHSDTGDPNCEYTVSYGDGSHSRGNLAFETLTLGSTTGSSVAIPKIPIGCGVNNAGEFDSKGSGIVGLGGGALSLITQLGSAIDYKFSYCLVPLFESKSTSKLNFGENAVVAGPGTVSTPIIPGIVNTFYLLKLEGMSVGPKRIEFVGDSTSNDAVGNTIIDSGTTLTFLPKYFYRKLESEVAAQINLERVKSPDQSLSLCYKSPPNNAIQAPLITAHFTGADVVLNSLNTFVGVSDNVTCFAFASLETEYSIFGNIAQTNHLVGYDLLKKIVSFKPTDCSKM
ncbi:Aspartic proteinase CDR1 [Spatholobus suberectus]|nr:Aspartic proteinase CDR1 [Spatholobus suberectus]